MEKEEMVKVAKEKSKGNIVLARLYLFALRNNLNPIDAKVSEHNNDKSFITFNINDENSNIIFSLANDILKQNLGNTIEMYSMNGNVFLKINSKENDNGNILNGYALRRLMAYINGAETINDSLLENTYLLFNEKNNDFLLNQTELEAAEIYLVENKNIVDSEIVFDKKDIENFLHKFSKTIKR